MKIIENIRKRYGCVKAVFYGRFSTEMQRDESIDAQLRAVKEYAIKNDIVIVNEYADKAQSGRYDNRPQFQQMIFDAKCKEFNLVLVHKLDRFARKRCDSIFYRTELKKYNVTLISVTEPLDDSPESIILESVLEGIAEYYSQNLSREVMKGLRENALKGIHCGGIPPLGYDVDPVTKKLVINEYEAYAVKLIFQYSLVGIGYKKIVQKLNEKGFVTKKGKNFSSNSIYEILHNEKYIGTYVYNKCEKRDDKGKANRHKYKSDDEIIRVEGIVPQIIDKDIFYKIQEIAENRKKRISNRAVETYLLTGKIFCGICGGSYVGERNLTRNKAYVYYSCNIRRRHAGAICQNKSIKRDDIEEVVINKIKEIMLDDFNIEYISELYMQYLTGMQNEHKTEIASIYKQIRETDANLKRITDVITAINSSALADRLFELETRKQKLQEYKRSLEDYRVKIFSKEEIKSNLFELIKMSHSEMLFKTLIDIFVDKIIVNIDNIEVYFKFKMFN